MKELNSWQLYKKRQEQCTVETFFVALYCSKVAFSWDQSRVARASLSVLSSDQSSVLMSSWRNQKPWPRMRDIGQTWVYSSLLPRVTSTLNINTRFMRSDLEDRDRREGGRWEWEYYLQRWGRREVALSAIKMLQISIHDSFSRVGKKLPWPGAAQVRVGVGVECILRSENLF